VQLRAWQMPTPSPTAPSTTVPALYPPIPIASQGTLVQSSAIWSVDSPTKWVASLSGQLYGNGLYTIEASSAFQWDVIWMGYPPWMVFDTGTTDPGGAWRSFNYNGEGKWDRGTLPSYTLDGNYYGDWVYICMPERIKLTSCGFTLRDSYWNRGPSMFRIYGSNDGITWSIVHDQAVPLPYAHYLRTTFTVAAVSAYSCLGLVVSALTGPDKILNFHKWDIWGLVCHLFCV
jgi:hypothetical protein